MAFRKAQRKQTKLRLGITGPAGSGKTYSALLIAFGLGGKIAMIDTENGSGDLYANLGDYDICSLSAPYDVRKYLALIAEAEKARVRHDNNRQSEPCMERRRRVAGHAEQDSCSLQVKQQLHGVEAVTPLHNKLIDECFLPLATS